MGQSERKHSREPHTSVELDLPELYQVLMIKGQEKSPQAPSSGRELAGIVKCARALLFLTRPALGETIC